MFEQKHPNGATGAVRDAGKVSGRQPVKVIVAQTAGFCKGVKSALELTFEAIRQRGENETICTFGPLIHNRQVLSKLEEEGVREENDIARCAGKKVVIRAHGVPPYLRNSLRQAGASILNATCKRVARVQAVIKGYARRGYHIVIVGDGDHAEVIGLMGYTDGLGTVISEPEDVERMPPEWRHVLLVAQTTQNEGIFEEIQKRFRHRYPEGVVKNTICGATQERQAEVRKLAAQVDAMVIVGGYHSGNTLRLAQVARDCGVPTYHVETEEELDAERMSAYSSVGVSAGASTPPWIIHSVARFLENLGAEE
jgi:4-hydroxy-3-methylbut-2-enyl diphosphate reductase